MVLPERRRGPSGPLDDVQEVSPRLYDAVVALNPADGDFTLPSAAFAALGGVGDIWVRSGVYEEEADIEMSSGSSMTGEGSSIIDLSGGFQVVAEETGTQTSAGTISVANGSTTVTGVATTFTALLVGGLLPANTFIGFGPNFYRVASVTSDLALELGEIYHGNPLSGLTYLAQQMVSGVQIDNMILTGAPSAPALRLERVRAFILDRMAIQSSGGAVGATPAFSIIDGGEGECKAISVTESNGEASNVIRCRSIKYTICNFSKSVGDGFEINACIAVSLDTCSINVNDGQGCDINGACEAIKFTDCTIQGNDLIGIEAAAAVESVIMSGCTIVQNQVGMNSTAERTVLEGCIVSENLSQGILFGAANPTASMTISDCVVEGNALDGVSLLGDNALVTASQCVGNGGDGIDVTGDNCVVNANRCRGNSAFGVLVRAAATDTIVTSNNLVGNTSGGLNDLGAGTIAANNKP